ncbi:hypothetical protein EYF80_056579 [Liparis tanakae]|uniref:Uncharacterized protein n=1 Tax=Liparis tanakae TaxID=230148 RepID=A0A4Z2EWD4_9TELE|nr:hypothetical protein EYF80_056579 [Liparis tanakae]
MGLNPEASRGLAAAAAGVAAAGEGAKSNRLLPVTGGVLLDALGRRHAGGGGGRKQRGNHGGGNLQGAGLDRAEVAPEGRTIFIFRASSSGLEAAGAALPGPGGGATAALGAAGGGAASRGAASRPLRVLVLVEMNGVPSCVVAAAGGGADVSASGAGGRINRRSD